MEELNISGIKAGAEEVDDDEAKEDAKGDISMADLLKKRRAAREIRKAREEAYPKTSIWFVLRFQKKLPQIQNKVTIIIHNVVVIRMAIVQ